MANWHLKPTTAIVILFLLVSCAKAPDISTQPQSFNFGTLMPGEIIEDTLWVKNTGKGVLLVAARSGCACVELENSLPDTILPGDSAELAIVYYAPDSAQVDKNSILLSTNDPQRKVIKIEMVAEIANRRLARTDSTITVIPIYIQNQALKPIAQKTIQKFFNTAKDRLGMSTISPIQIAEHISNDYQYKKRPIEDVIRKWALMDSVRWVIACRITMKDSLIMFSSILVDGFSEFPIMFNFETNAEEAPDSFINTVSNIFANYTKHKKDAIMKGMQRKWARQRSLIIEKPLPRIKLVNVIKGDTIDARSLTGEVIVLHFFSIDCEHCEKEMEWLTKLTETHPRNLLVYGVSIDMGEFEKVRDFASEQNLPYPVVLPTEDSHRRFTRIYGGATPQTIVVDKKGNVAEFFVGFNETLIHRLETTIKRLTR